MSYISTPGRDRGRRRVVLGLAAILVLAVMAGGWAGWRTVAADRDATSFADRRRAAARRDTRSLEARHDATVRSIATLEAALRARTAERDERGGSLFAAAGQLAEIRASLRRELSGLEALDVRVRSLQGCLVGVEGALNALSIGDTTTAVSRLRAVSSECEAV